MPAAAANFYAQETIVDRDSGVIRKGKCHKVSIFNCCASLLPPPVGWLINLGMKLALHVDNYADQVNTKRQFWYPSRSMWHMAFMHLADIVLRRLLRWCVNILFY